jgi:hypothetical protein
MITRLALTVAILVALPLAGCNDGGSSGGTGGSGGMAGSGGTGGAGGTRVDTCAGVTCDDGDACTADSCDPSDGSCVHDPTVTNACRTRIEVTFPPRGATLEGDGADPTLRVTGRVGSDLGDIAELTLNDAPVTVAPDGSFVHVVDVQVGGNTLVFSATDSAGNARSRVQSFLWSTGYLKPVVPKEGIAPQGLGIWLSQQVLDDGQAAPPTDFAQIMNSVLQSLDLSSLIDSNQSVVSQAGYDVYITSINFGNSSVTINAIDGGMAIQARLTNITGGLRFDCTNVSCLLLGGDSSGSYSISSVVLNANVIPSVTPTNTLAVSLSNVSTSVNGLDVSSNNAFTDFLLAIIEVFIGDALSSDLEGLLNDALGDVLGPLLADALNALAFSLSLDVPRLGGDSSIPVDLVTDFESVDFDGGAPKGGAIIERGGAYTAATVTPYDNLGVPNRDACGAGGQTLTLLRQAPLELGFSDDLLNQLLYAVWRGGWLEVEVGPELLGGMDLTGLGITDLALTLSGWLAPTVSDCNPDGELRIYAGDLQILGSLSLNGEPVTFTGYTTLEGDVIFTVMPEGLGIGIGGINQADTEVTIHEDEHLEAEPLITTLLETALVNAIEGALGGGGLGTIPLPEIDLSSALGQPPGTSLILMMPQTVERSGGATILGATL